ncbi:MAG: hypothetical protein RI920_1085 [Pseudomonadota bacterium]|jgi:KDO2-lipid IV(A) lauroyltransferase
MPRIFTLLCHWPLWLLHALGATMGWVAYLASPSYRRRLATHSTAAGLGRARRWAAVGHAGKLVGELPYLWGRPQAERLGERVHWVGRDELAQAVAAGRGVMVLTPHVGAFEVVAQAYAEAFGTERPMTALYRPAKQAWLADMMRVSRLRPGLLTGPATLAGVRQMLRALKKGDTVGILPDQVPPEGMGVWAPFFGRPAYTMTMASKLVAQTGCAVVMIRGQRLGLLQRLREGCSYIVHADRVPAALEAVMAGSDATTAATVLNQLMEQMILASPEQYLWGYNRYKGPRAEILTSAGGQP